MKMHSISSESDIFGDGGRGAAVLKRQVMEKKRYAAS